MAETRFSDCPRCGRTNVVGYEVESKDEKVGKIAVTGGAAGLGALWGGPIGAGIGFAIGKYLEKKLPKLVNDENTDCEFKFKCPKCGYEFSEYFKFL